jgi:cytochrome c oxidase assembly protein subunit 15
MASTRLLGSMTTMMMPPPSMLLLCSRRGFQAAAASGGGPCVARNLAARSFHQSTMRALPSRHLLQLTQGLRETQSHFQPRNISARLLHRSSRKSAAIVLPSESIATTSSSASATAAVSPIISSTSSSSSTGESEQLPRLTAPSVSTHLFVIAGLVFAIVVVGGLTRLTESGLSITEWNLVTGTLPPLSHEDWLSEYNKYMVTPEGQLMNKGMTIDEFKNIYVWEWGHRFLGRIIGLAFLAPIPYYLYKRKLSSKSAGMLFAIATLIGGQGALGWYMVKSGLTHEAIQARDGVPRVSQYRLAAHLGMAFLVYSLALRHAIGVRRDFNLAKLGKAIGGKLNSVQESLRLLNTPQAKRVRLLVTGLTGLIFITAISGESLIFSLTHSTMT